MKSSVLKMLSVLDPRRQFNDSMLVKLAKKFPNAISSEELDCLVAQFADYRTITDAEIALMPSAADEFLG